MKTYVYIAKSLDGFIARQDGSLDWLDSLANSENQDYGYMDFISGIDAIIAGRKTYETVLRFKEWPYTKPLFVLTKTLKELPDHLHGRVQFINDSLKSILADLEKRDLKNLYIDGGATIQGFLAEDLIDELIITTVPILLGEGVKLFGSLKKDLIFDCIETVAYKNGLVKNHYVRKRDQA